MHPFNKACFKLFTQNCLILLLCLTTILVVPLIDDKIIPGHDFVFHVTRIIDVSEAWQEGVFPVRMYADKVQFWGTPVGIFYPGLFVCIPALLKLAGVPIEICYNFFIAMIFYLAAICSWYGFSILTKSKRTGFYSAVLYISSAWYLLEIYIRNALGEAMGLAFLPLALACVIEFITQKRVSIKHYILGILSFSAIIESHVLSSVFLALCGVFLIIVHIRKISPTIVTRLFGIGLIIFLLNASFIVPFLIFYVNVPVDIDFVEYFSQSGYPSGALFLFVFLFNFWLVLALHSLLKSNKWMIPRTCYYKKGIKTKMVFVFGQYFLWGIFFLLLSSDLMPWSYFPLLTKTLEFMQFSWRF